MRTPKLFWSVKAPKPPSQKAAAARAGNKRIAMGERGNNSNFAIMLGVIHILMLFFFAHMTEIVPSKNDNGGIIV